MDEMNLKEGPEFEKQNTFLKWFDDNGVSLNKIKLVCLGHEDRIVTAKRDISKGEVVLSIPEKLFFQSKEDDIHPTPEICKKIRNHPELEKLLTFDIEVMVIVVQILVFQDQPIEFFRPYIETLPEESFHEHPLFTVHNNLESFKMLKSYQCGKQLAENYAKLKENVAVMHEQFPELKKYDVGQFLYAFLKKHTRAYGY